MSNEIEEDTVEDNKQSGWDNKPDIAGSEVIDVPVENTVAFNIKDDDDDEYVDNQINTDPIPSNIPANFTTEDLMSLPGSGITVGPTYIAPPPPIPRGSGKNYPTAGRPKFQPTDEQRRYVYRCLAINGDTLHNIAHNIGITYLTLVKHFDYEINLGREVMHTAVKGVAYRNAKRSEYIPAYQKSVDTFLRIHGLITDKKEIDVTNSDGSMGAGVVVVPAVASSRVPDAEDKDIPQLT